METANKQRSSGSSGSINTASKPTAQKGGVDNEKPAVDNNGSVTKAATEQTSNVGQGPSVENL